MMTFLPSRPRSLKIERALPTPLPTKRSVSADSMKDLSSSRISTYFLTVDYVVSTCCSICWWLCLILWEGNVTVKIDWDPDFIAVNGTYAGLADSCLLASLSSGCVSPMLCKTTPSSYSLFSLSWQALIISSSLFVVSYYYCSINLRCCCSFCCKASYSSASSSSTSCLFLLAPNYFLRSKSSSMLTGLEIAIFLGFLKEVLTGGLDAS